MIPFSYFIRILILKSSFKIIFYGFFNVKKKEKKKKKINIKKDCTTAIRLASLHFLCFKHHNSIWF